MALKKALVLAVLLLTAGMATAAEESRIYVIKKGDTLWGISERFIKDPFYWPNLWATNPYIRNPHFIYPGQKLRIFPDRIEFVTAETEPAQIVEPAPEVEAPPVVRESITVKAFGGDGYIDSLVSSVGTLVDATDNRIMMGTGDRVFVELTDPGRVAPGDRFTLFHLGERVRHPQTNEYIGYLVSDLGTIQISEIHPQVASAQIIEAHREILRGALLRPYQPPRREVELKEAVAPLAGTLIGSTEKNLALGQNMVAYIDLGSEDGLEAGNLMIISRPRKATEIARQNRGPWAESLELPEIVLGAGVVIETRSRTASLLIVKSVDAINRGDRVHAEMR
ncbi:LysM domain-containing protein [Geoalkalibacter ferrihydriticus]|uniref:LysM domain-containing protein n=2 Tax=Geoalkalibacter ferrihydriticus TaxID=392333 RepID=A0A0C2EH97_9BACT|nr:LysM peptidoglycan-binding domain-containing protein [Geoalkalibacter ferrihydriticus]KIH78048.1 hypothetical protein GFER_05520 [Geoalkalibacter ferrihydriticus DSM 17813]SDM31593.1 LysM domain-containing protein [Geoalkalibacter ferrihydriticus]